MLTDFALDLRLARRKSGLSQKEVAYLLAIDQSTFSAVERGQKPPSLRQICQLSLIYGRSFHSLFEEIAAAVKPELGKRAEKLPPKSRPSVSLFNRSNTLKRLRRRLETLTITHGRA